MEEPFAIFPMQGFCNNIYNNAQEIIGWDPREGNKNVERVTEVIDDVIDVGTGGGILALV